MKKMILSAFALMLMVPSIAFAYPTDGGGCTMERLRDPFTGQYVWVCK